MARHLNISRWFTTGPNGNLKRKRVSAKLEQQFPKHLRQIYQEQGPVQLVKFVQIARNLSLAQAWNEVKSMFNS